MSHLFGKLDIELLESGEFADAVIECGDKSWKVHKAIVCKRSEWFRTALTGGFMEADISKITIHDYSPHRIEWMLKWMYSGENAFKSLVTETGNTLIAAVEAYLTADYFMLGELKSLVCDLLWEDLSEIIKTIQHVSSPEYIQHFLLAGKPMPAKSFYRILFDAVNFVYGLESHYDDLRQMFVEFGIRTRSGLLKVAEFTSLLIEQPRFATDVLIQAVSGDLAGRDTSAYPRDARCQKCKSRLEADGVHAAREFCRGKNRYWTCSLCFDGSKNV